MDNDENYKHRKAAEELASLFQTAINVTMFELVLIENPEKLLKTNSLATVSTTPYTGKVSIQDPHERQIKFEPMGIPNKSAKNYKTLVKLFD